MDYNAFRNTSAKGSAVSVNHKALITRALTKYPVDYALFRELLQNSADAQANSAVIEFETTLAEFSPSTLHQAPVKRLRFSNDGLDFTREDWNRLREIASGNPNESKIGAFGVGFYSVFELSDEPLVHSGTKIMNFRYEGVQLHYHFAENATQHQKGTLIDLPYRSSGELPDLVKFVGFLVQSFLLVNLNEVKLQIKFANNDVQPLLHLSKTTKTPVKMPFPAGLRPYSPQEMLKVSQLERSDVVIKLRYLNASQSPPLTLSKGVFSFGKQLISTFTTDSGNPTDFSELECSLMRVDCYADVRVSSSFRQQMIDTLLKPPPKRAQLSLIALASGTTLETAGKLKAYVVPEDFQDSRVFIGFPTKQSTGMRSHLALNHIIPTLERAAVDMSNSFVKEWNSEMLFVAGIMARCTYEYELGVAQKLVKSQQIAAAQEILDRFEFGASSPDRIIGDHVRAGFWHASRQTLVLSSQGILPNTEVRVAENIEFLRTTPVITNKKLADELKELGMIENVSLKDLLRDVRASPLNPETAKQFMEWIRKTGTHLVGLEGVVVKFEATNYDLGRMRHFYDAAVLPDAEVASTLPVTTLPQTLASELGSTNLLALGLNPLDLLTWTLSRLAVLDTVNTTTTTTTTTTKGSSTSSTTKSMKKLLQVVVHTWDRTPRGMRLQLTKLLAACHSIPTQLGLKPPKETYLAPIRLFPDLPVVDATAGLPSPWLAELGVRRSLDMQFVLGALKGRKLKWTNENLLEYISENADDLTSNDWKIVNDGQFFVSQSGEMHMANSLYAPDARLARLGFNTIKLEGWSRNSTQGQLLLRLGLNEFPTEAELFTGDKELALAYYLDKFSEARYRAARIQEFSVVPTTTNDWLVPREVFSDEKMAAFRLPVLRKNLEASKLGVLESPPLHQLISRVMAAPTTYLGTSGAFERVIAYFSSHVGNLTDADIRQCQSTAFIPLIDPASKTTKWYKPTEVYLPYNNNNSHGGGGEEDDEEDALRPLLRTIKPLRSTISFFRTLGVKDRPTIVQLAQLLVQDAQKVRDVFSGPEGYEGLLYHIHRHYNALNAHPRLVDQLEHAPFMLGKRYTGEESVLGLYRPQDLVIADDIVAYKQFQHQLVVCPPADHLEQLAAKLGVRRISELLEETVVLGKPVVDEKKLRELEKRVNQRLQLFRENTAKEMKRDAPTTIKLALLSKIEVVRRLPPHKAVTVPTSACMDPHEAGKLLVVPGQLEWIDVATALVKTLLSAPDQDSAVVLEVQLASNIEALERKGYNVRRIRETTLGERITKYFERDVKEEEYPESDEAVDVEQQPLLTHQTEPLHQQPQQQQQPPQQQPPQQQQPLPPLQKTPTQSMRAIQPPSQSDTRPEPKQSLAQKLMSGLNLRKDERNNRLSSGPSTNSPSTNGSGFNGSGFDAPPRGDALGPSGTTPGGPNTQPIPLEYTLEHGRASARAFSGSSMQRKQHVDAPPPQQLATLCHVPSIGHYSLVGTTPNGTKVFGDGRAAPQQNETVLSDILAQLCGVLRYPREAVSLFREDSDLVAFNSNGSLFFNSSHAVDVDLLDYYFVVMAHEMAHNLVTDHGASHSFYTESYIQHSLDRLRA